MMRTNGSLLKEMNFQVTLLTTEGVSIITLAEST